MMDRVRLYALGSVKDKGAKHAIQAYSDWCVGFSGDFNSD